MKKIISVFLMFVLIWLLLIGCNDITEAPLDDTTNNITDSPTNKVTNSRPDIPNNTTESYPDEDANPESDFEYKVRDDGEFEITKYIGNDKNVVIPKKIDGKTVTVIGMSAFSGSLVESLVMPDTIKYTSFGAFNGCKNLKDIKMSSSLITVSLAAFHDCKSLTSIDLSMSSLKYIDEEAFSGCENLKTVKFGDNVILIGDKAFFGCASLEEIILPKNLQEIGEQAFLNCFNVKKIWIPKTLEKWGYYPFPASASVTEIIFEDGLKQIGGVENVLCYNGKIETLRIPASVELISSGAFWDCANLKEIYFEGNAPQIGNGKFIDFATPVESVKIYYNPSKSGWDTTPLRDIYTLIPLFTIGLG